jgi:hypothetical protein
VRHEQISHLGSAPERLKRKSLEGLQKKSGAAPNRWSKDFTRHLGFYKRANLRDSI